MRKIKANIAPSILSADFAFLGEECRKMVQAGADSLHVDIMDNHFVPNLTIGAPVLKCLSKHIKNSFFDCHIMVSKPEDFIEPLYQAGANGITFHYESTYKDIKDVCQAIRDKKMKVGLSVKPKTPLDEKIKDLIRQGHVDLLLVMTVEPGFGGQKFMADMMLKVKELRSEFPDLDIQVDGGITQQNIEIASENGANCIVSGTGIFASKDPKTTIEKMRHSVNKRLSL